MRWRRRVIARRPQSTTTARVRRPPARRAGLSRDRSRGRAATRPPRADRRRSGSIRRERGPARDRAKPSPRRSSSRRRGTTSVTRSELAAVDPRRRTSLALRAPPNALATCRFREPAPRPHASPPQARVTASARGRSGLARALRIVWRSCRSAFRVPRGRRAQRRRDECRAIPPRCRWGPPCSSGAATTGWAWPATPFVASDDLADCRCNLCISRAASGRRGRLPSLRAPAALCSPSMSRGVCRWAGRSQRASGPARRR